LKSTIPTQLVLEGTVRVLDGIVVTHASFSCQRGLGISRGRRRNQQKKHFENLLSATMTEALPQQEEEPKESPSKVKTTDPA
jgi:ribosomal protein S4